MSSKDVGTLGVPAKASLQDAREGTERERRSEEVVPAEDVDSICSFRLGLRGTELASEIQRRGQSIESSQP